MQVQTRRNIRQYVEYDKEIADKEKLIHAHQEKGREAAESIIPIREKQMLLRTQLSSEHVRMP